jgi:DNA polymerase III epsilon subunit-like protein
MRPYVSINIETTGLDPENCQVIEIGAVIDNWEDPVDELPCFSTFIKYDFYYGEPFALGMHPKIFKTLADETLQFPTEDEVAEMFHSWLCRNEIFPRKRHIIAAGKNYGTFDHQFLKRLPKWENLNPTCHRTIEPSMLYWQPNIDDGPPNMKTCLSRAGLPTDVSYNALEDALQVVELVRAWYRSTEQVT